VYQYGGTKESAAPRGESRGGPRQLECTVQGRTFPIYNFAFYYGWLLPGAVFQVAWAR
jgi:hypothetical protein